MTLRILPPLVLLVAAAGLSIASAQRTSASQATADYANQAATGGVAPAPEDGVALDLRRATLLAAEYRSASRACGSEHPAGDLIETIEGRQYRLHVPARYTPAAPAALVVSYSGYGRTAAEQEAYSGLAPLADQEGFILVTPEGSGSTPGWDIVGVYNENGVDDVAFTAALVDQLEGELCIDTSRIYAAGISNGAEMASQVACDLPGTFAAVAAVAGVINQGCATPVPVIAFHGTADENIPFDWAPAAVEAWAETNRCAGPAGATRLSEHVELVAYSGCDAHLEFYIVDGGGHTWPGAEGDGGAGPTTHEISASAIMWRFFAEHAKPAPGD